MDARYRERVRALFRDTPTYTVPVATQAPPSWNETEMITLPPLEDEKGEREKVQVPTTILKIADADGRTITEWYLPRPHKCKNPRVQQMIPMDVALLILQERGRDAFTVSVEHQYERMNKDTNTVEMCSTRYFGGFTSEREGVRILNQCNYHAYEVTLDKGKRYLYLDIEAEEDELVIEEVDLLGAVFTIMKYVLADLGCELRWEDVGILRATRPGKISFHVKFGNIYFATYEDEYLFKMYISNFLENPPKHLKDLVDTHVNFIKKLTNGDALRHTIDTSTLGRRRGQMRYKH